MGLLLFFFSLLFLGLINILSYLFIFIVIIFLFVFVFFTQSMYQNICQYKQICVVIYFLSFCFVASRVCRLYDCNECVLRGFEAFVEQDGVVSNTVVEISLFTADQKIQHTDLLIKQSFNDYIYIYEIYSKLLFCTVFFLYNTV